MSTKSLDLHRRRSLQGLVFLPPFLGFVVSIISGWPACLNPDIANTIRDGLNFEFLGYQAPTFGFIWAIVLAVLPLPITIEAFFVTQVVGYWLVFALLGWAALREQSVVMACVAAFAGFLPPLLGTVVLVESNMQAGIAWSLAIALAFAFPGRRSLLVGVALIFYGYLARSGMIVAVTPMLLACFLLNRPDLSVARAGLWSVGCAVVFVLISFSVTQLVLGGATRGVILGISQLFDIAGVYEKTHSHCMPPSLVPATITAEEILTQYNPEFVSPILWGSKGGFLEPTLPGQQADLRACWMSTIRHHPKEYLQVKARFALMFLNIGEKRPMRIALSCEPANPDFGLAVPDNVAWTVIRRYILGSADMLVWRGWCWFSLTGLTCVLALALGVPRAYAGLGVFLSALGTLVPHFLFGQGVVARYVFLPYLLCLCCLVLLGGPVLRSIRALWLHR